MLFPLRLQHYPLKLVTTNGHLFLRWDNGKECFNVEATNHGLKHFPDDSYRHWPFEITAAEKAAEGCLKSLTPPEELGRVPLFVLVAASFQFITTQPAQNCAYSLNATILITEL